MLLSSPAMDWRVKARQASSGPIGEEHKARQVRRTGQAWLRRGTARQAGSGKRRPGLLGQGMAGLEAWSRPGKGKAWLVSSGRLGSARYGPAGVAWLLGHG